MPVVAGLHALPGCVGVCGVCVATLSGVTGLGELGLSKVQLIYDQVCGCGCVRVVCGGGVELLLSATLNPLNERILNRVSSPPSPPCPSL